MPRKPEQPSLFKNLKERGDEVPRDQPVPLDVYCYILDPETGEKTGYVRRDRWRTYNEVYADLLRYTDIVHCSQWCGFEKPRADYGVGNYSWVDEPCPNHPGCAGHLEGLVDEYFSMMEPTRQGGDVVIPPIERPCAFPVVGGNEGHYIHVGGVAAASREDGREEATFHLLALGKTFQGWAHAVRMANRLSSLLWNETLDKTWQGLPEPASVDD